MRIVRCLLIVVHWSSLSFVDRRLLFVVRVLLFVVVADCRCRCLLLFVRGSLCVRCLLLVGCWLLGVVALFGVLVVVYWVLAVVVCRRCSLFVVCVGFARYVLMFVMFSG